MMRSCRILFFVFAFLLTLIASVIAQQQNAPGYGMGTGAAPKQGPGGVYVAGNGVKPPVALQQPLPAYTPEARAARVEGVVIVQAVVRKDGSVDYFKVHRGLGYGLDESAINTIATKWRFSPGTLNGEPVDVMAIINVSFRLSIDPAEMGSLEPYSLRVQIIASQLNGTPLPNIDVSGYGNVWNGYSGSGFTYQCSCPQSIVPRVYQGRWIESESRLEIALGYDQSTQKQKTCELKLQIQQAPYTLQNAPVAPAGPSQ
jgi:TonB family protein